MIQVGGNDIALPQSIVLSMQPTYMDAYLFVFAECITVVAHAERLARFWKLCISSLDLLQ